MNIYVHLDYKTSSDVGADDFFQIVSIERDDAGDITDQFDVGRHYSDHAELKDTISEQLKIAAGEIDLIEV